MGLIQRVIESWGVPTVSVSLVRAYAEKVRPPRAVFLHWPFGHPMGEPGHVNQQHAVLALALEALHDVRRAGTILDPGWRWRREHYPTPQWLPAPGETD